MKSKSRWGFAFVSFAFIAVVASGCSGPADEASKGPAPSDLPAVGDDDATESEDGPTPNDDPALGADAVEIDTGIDDGAERELGVSDVPDHLVSAGGCVKGGLYCGGDKVIGNANTLYRCNGTSTPSVVARCAAGCSVNPGRDDSCKPSASGRAASPVPGKSVTYPYGVRNSRYAAGFHTGEDYATPTGSSAVAVRSGTIRWSNDNGGAYGKWIGLDADNGRTYVYCHLSSRLVAAGTRVVAGQRIARTGATGNVTGPHLHFEDHPRGPFVYAQVRKPSW